MQITKIQFKKIILVYGIATLTYVGLGFFVGSSLDTVETIPVLLGVYSFVVLIFLVWVMQNIVALYKFKPTAPKHLFIISVLGLLFYLGNFFFEIETIYTDSQILLSVVSYIAYDIAMFLSGVIVALSHFSNIASEFKKPLEVTSPLN